ncbi:MAG: polysaccharide deacetylase family protein [Oligoflexus sp.]
MKGLGKQIPRMGNRFRFLLDSMMLTVLSISSACSQIVSEPKTSCVTNATGINRDAFSGQELDQGQLSLIFTGGPNDFTSEISSFLTENQIQASFFVEGQFIKEHRETLKQVFADGHLIGNGGYSGEDLVSSKAATIEVRMTDHLIEPFIKGNMFLLHPPKGIINDRVRRLLNESGLGKYVGPILPLAGQGNQEFITDEQCWSQGLDIDSCVDIYRNEIDRIQRGIVSFSNQSGETLELIRRILPVLDFEGFSFVRLDEVPSVHFALRSSGGKPLQNDQSAPCFDYE